jgi:hypothetical protein
MKKDKGPKRTRVLSIRVGDDTFEWLAKLAEKNTRTMSNQIEHLLRIARLTVEQTDGLDDITVVREKLSVYKTKTSKETHE